MVLLFYVFVMHGQMIIGRAEFDTMERCQREGLPRVEAEYPGAGAACMIVRDLGVHPG